MSTPTPQDEDELNSLPTRTLAIIKTHATKHRLTIERRILEAGFEIIKERQMEFDPASDEDFLHELFGRDTPSLFEGPVWVYVLERWSAVEQWNALMGHPDPAAARETEPSSLRAIYGMSLEQNAFMGSPDAATAEEQIACLFVSSPPFPPTELPADGEEREPLSWPESDLMASSSSGMPMSTRSLSHDVSPSRSRKASSNGSVKPTADKSTTGKVLFRARPMPSTTAVASIQPRTTRAAALRAGLPVELNTTARRPRTAPTREEQKQAFMDVPGHKRSETIQVASTAPPAVAPRMTRAASLRLGQPTAPNRTPARPRPQMGGSGDVIGSRATFDGVPGHKRRETISVASVKAPVLAPRPTKSSALRAQKDAAPPSSYMFRKPSVPKTPGTLSRNPSQTSLSTLGRPGSQASARTDSTSAPPPLAATKTASQSSVPQAPIARPPSITPRSNRSALLRANSGGVAQPVSPAKKNLQSRHPPTATVKAPSHRVVIV